MQNILLIGYKTLHRTAKQQVLISFQTAFQLSKSAVSKKLNSKIALTTPEIEFLESKLKTYKAI